MVFLKGLCVYMCGLMCSLYHPEGATSISIGLVQNCYCSFDPYLKFVVLGRFIIYGGGEGEGGGGGKIDRQKKKRP